MELKLQLRMERKRIKEAIEFLVRNFQFEPAAVIYRQYGSNRTLITLLDSPNSFVESQLRKALPELLAELETEPQPTEGVLSLDLDWKKEYKRLARVHDRLTEMSDAERAKAAADIKDTFKDKIIPAWEKLDAWRESGELPAEPVEQLPEDRAELQKKLANTRSSLSKARKRGNTAKVEALEILIQQIENKLAL